MSHSVEHQVHLRRRAVGEYRISLRSAEYHYAVAGANGGTHRVMMRGHDLCRIVGQRKRNRHLPAFGIDKRFCNCLCCHIGHGGIGQLNVDDRVGRKSHVLVIGDRAGHLGAACLGMAGNPREQ